MKNFVLDMRHNSDDTKIVNNETVVAKPERKGQLFIEDFEDMEAGTALMMFSGARHWAVGRFERIRDGKKGKRLCASNGATYLCDRGIEEYKILGLRGWHATNWVRLATEEEKARLEASGAKFIEGSFS